MSSQAGLRSCTLTNADDQAVSGAASTCVRADSRVVYLLARASQVLICNWEVRRQGGRLQGAWWQHAACERSHARIHSSLNC